MAPPEHGTWIIGDRRESDRRTPKMHEPVSLKVFVTVLSSVIVAGILWLSSTGAGSVTSSTRFEKDSARRDYESAAMRRDVMDVYRATMRNDSTSRCILARIEKRHSPFCQ